MAAEHNAVRPLHVTHLLQRQRLPLLPLLQLPTAPFAAVAGAGVREHLRPAVQQHGARLACRAEKHTSNRTAVA
jgi:hypothetical protein